jgi:hypothetical protein
MSNVQCHFLANKNLPLVLAQSKHTICSSLEAINFVRLLRYKAKITFERKRLVIPGLKY